LEKCLYCGEDLKYPPTCCSLAYDDYIESIKNEIISDINDKYEGLEY
jgi:hypothetical protein